MSQGKLKKPLSLVRWHFGDRFGTDCLANSGLALKCTAKLETMDSEQGKVIVAEFVALERGCKSDRSHFAAVLVQVRAEKAVIAVVRIDCLARDFWLVLKLANEAENNGMRTLSSASIRTMIELPVLV